MWWLKNCWSFSLTKLMEICSKPLYSKISKPAMSSTAQKFAFFTNGKNERCSSLAHLECGVDQSVVTFDDQPLEQSVKDSTGNATNGSCSLFTSLTCVGKKVESFSESAFLTFGHPLRPDLDPWLAERLDRVERVDQKCPKGFARE